jgi:hypothetical protein
MAYDDSLADRVEKLIVDQPGFSAKKMFGGIGFMLHGNMSCGVYGDELIVRVDPDDTDTLLAKPHVRIFDITGRPMRGWLLVGPEATATAKGLRGWVERGVDFAASLPPK